MTIHIKDILKLNSLKGLRPLTDGYGLDRSVTNVGLLDHELIEGNFEVFKKGEFVLSTLSVARNDSPLVFNAVKALIIRKASGLAIKTIYYNSLPDEIIAFAKENNFPIFIFSDVYMEDIINDVNQVLESRYIHNIYEAKLESLLSNQVTYHMTHQIINELNPMFLNHHHVYYLKKKQFVSVNKLMDYSDTFNQQSSLKEHRIFKFRTGLLVILTFKTLQEDFAVFKGMMQFIGLNLEDYYVGKSLNKSSLIEMTTSINEAIVANQTAEIKNNNFLHYEELGYYKMIIPLLEQPWAVNYAENILEPIIKYDQSYDAQLYQTIKVYFESGCHTKTTSEKMYLHKNTILYRVNKVKELLGPFKNDLEFTTELAMAIAIRESLFQSSKYR